MPTIDEMLSQYASFGAPEQGTSNIVGLSVDQKTALKQAEVAAVSQRKREVLSGKSISEQEAYRLGISKSTGYGADSAPALSRALLNEPIDKLVSVDGPETALRLLRQQISGNTAYGIDKNMPTNTTNNITDTALNIASGAVNTIGGAGAWVGSKINDKLGTTLSGSLDAFNNFVEPLASDRSQSSRTVSRITNELDTRDNLAQYDKDEANGDVLATLKREGKNALGAVSIAASDPTMLLEGTAKGVGSMAAFGAVNKAVQGIGGVGKIATMIRDASMPISGGLVSGGSVYHQNASDIMAKSPEEMAKISPQFNEYVSQGMSPKDAQIRVASESGEYAANIAAPLGAMTTMMAPGLEKLPVKVSSIKGAIKDTAFEPVQEAAESFNEQFASNAGKAAKFNPKQDMAEGMGKAVGEGALYGLTSAGATQAPGAAGLIAKAASNKITTGVSSVVGSVMEKAESLKKKNEADSTVSDTAIAQRAVTVADQTPVIAATMQAAVKDDPAMQEKVANLTAIMQSVSSHDPSDFEGTSDSIKASLAGSKTKIDELNALKSVFHSKDSTDADKDFAGAKLIDELGAVGAFLDTQTDVIGAVQDEPTKQFIRDLKQLSADTLSNKEFIATKNEVATRLAEKHKVSQPELVIASDPTTEEAKQAIMETLAVASTLPTEARKEAVEAILKHSASGALKLTPEQKSNLEVSKAAIAALQDNLVEGSELMRVSVEAGNASQAGDKGKSAIQHATDIVKTMSEGNTSLAKTLLEGFGRFAQHYQNKAEAVNQATQEVPAEQKNNKYKGLYQQLANGQWLKEPAVFTFQKSGRGVELAVQVHKEARAIGSMYNAIAAMYPEMGLESVKLTEPDPIFLPDGKFDPKATQQGIAGNELAGIAAYRKRLSTKKLKGAKNGQGQKEEVLTTPVAPATPTTPPVKSPADISIKRAQATVQSWKRRYGVKAKVSVVYDNSIKSRGLAQFDETSGEYSIVLNTSKMDNLLLSTTLAHEFGHVLMREQFDNASDEVKQEILNAYRKDVDLFSKNGSKKTFADKFANPGSRKIQEGAIEQTTGDAGIDYANRRDVAYEATSMNANVSKYSPDQGYSTSFEEWFANQFAKHTVQESVGENITQREKAFWKTAIKKVKDFFDQVVLQIKPDAVFSSWIASITKNKILSKTKNKKDALAEANKDNTHQLVEEKPVSTVASEPAKVLPSALTNKTNVTKLEVTQAEYDEAIKLNALTGELAEDAMDSASERVLKILEALENAPDSIVITATVPSTTSTAAPTKVILEKVSPYHAKDQAKSDKATKFIGLGAPGSSTESYRTSWGKLANSGSYTSEDIVFVSSNGNRPGRRSPNFEELAKAIAAGATILTDGKKDRERSYNIGEREVAEYLLLNKYEELIDGTWTLKAVVTPATASVNKAPEIVGPAIDESAGLSDLSNTDPKIVAATDGALERLWESRYKANTLFSNLGLSKLLSTAGNLLIAGTEFVKENRASKLVGDPFSIFKELTSNPPAVSTIEAGAIKTLRKYILQRANVLKLGINEAVLNELNKDNKLNLIQLLQINHTDALGNPNKYRVDRFSRHRLFSLLAPVADGTSPELQLDPALVEAATLAFVQWELSHADKKSFVDAKSVANILGIDENTVTEDQIAEFTVGITNVEAIDMLGDAIMRHWSLQPKSNMPSGFNEGIAKVLGKELLDIVVKNNIGITMVANKGSDNKVVNTYFIDPLDEKIADANAIYPELINSIAFTDNEVPVYIGDGKEVPISETILRAPEQKLSDEQKAAQKTNQDTIHRLDENAFALIMGIGVEGIQKILGIPDFDAPYLNKAHKKTVDGVLQGLNAAFDKMSQIHKRIVAVAGEGGDIGNVPVRYKHEYISTNRLQMMGAHNPQANKWMRHIILPTRTTVDMTNKTNLDTFMLAVAQGLGKSIHNKKPSVSIAEIELELNNKYANSVALLQKWLAKRESNKEANLPGEIIDELKSAFGAKFSAAGLYALQEYARYLNTSAKDKKAFTTAIYIEADGVTNGPGAALMMLSGIGKLSRKFFSNAARVGYFFGSPDMTLNEYRSSTTESLDLYAETASIFPNKLADLKNGLPTEFSGYFDAVIRVASNLLSDFNLKDDGTYEVTRGLTKSPLTKTVYGSSSKGMGDGILKDMLEAYYAKLSEVMRLMSEADYTQDQAINSVFGPNYAQLSADLDLLSQTSVFINKKGNYTFSETTSNAPLISGANPLNIEATGAHLDNLSTNINTFFAIPMREAISEVMSPAVMEGSAQLIRSTSLASDFMIYEFNKLYAAAVARRQDTDALYKKSDGLSRDDIAEITAKLGKMFPFIKTQYQSFDPTGKVRVSAKNEIARTLNESYKISPTVFAPESPGVAGVPYMIIGQGDARTIQIFSKDGPTTVLCIYDGIHMPIDYVRNYSERANSAVWEAWRSNPFEAILPSMTKFVSGYDWEGFFRDNPNVDKDAILDNIYAQLDNTARYAARISATHKELMKYSASIDQMASVGANHSYDATNVVLDDSLIDSMNSSIEQESSDYITPSVRTALDKLNRASVNQEYAVKDFIDEIQSMGGDINTLKLVATSELLSGYTATIGTADSGKIKLKSGDLGATDVANKIIHVVSGNRAVETATHELVHAATYEAISNYYKNPNSSPISIEVIRLTRLMERFLSDKDNILSTDESISSAVNQINSTTSPAAKLNEFMAWGLSNDSVRAELSSKAKIEKNKYTTAIRKLVANILKAFGITLPENQYQELVFNTASIIAATKPSTTTDSQILKMNIGILGTNDRLSTVTDFFATSLAKHLKNQIDPAFANLPPKIIHTKNPGEFTRAQRLGAQVSNLIASKFNSNHQEQMALNMIVQTLATGVELDENILSGVEELYAHFAKGLKAEDFLLVDPVAATQADVYEANEMYNLVMGNFNTAKDVYGRGQTLPIFFALGLVNDRFRAVLAKKGLPDALKIASTDTDAFLTSSANVLMSKLDKALTGTAKARNTQEALDSVFSVLVQNGTDAATLAGTGLNKAGSVVDGMNDRVVSALEYVSAKLDSGADSVLASSSNKTVQAAANVTKNIALAMNENTAARVGEFAVSLSNQSNLFKPLKSLITDFVGRTDSNKLLYDMIKFVRSTVQQDRQHYREELPSVLAAQFTRKLSDKEWTHLFYGLAKTDLAQLVDVIGIKDTVALLNDPTKINTRIVSLESNLRTQVPKSWPRLQKKAEQLANFMLTGKYGPMLLRNADAIQLNYGGNRDDIDSLVTLYALKNLEQPIKDTLSSLVQTEKAGIDTLVGYLSGQRKDDIHPDQVVRLNAYKGYIPSLQNESVSLRVESDTEHAAMLEKGYIRVGKYTGSTLENRGSYSYYFLNAPARAPFSQGLVQNVNSTSGGIDTMTMFTNGPVAGRITDPRAVNKLSPYLNNDNLFDENLLPIFDKTGAIVALERGIDPTKLAMLKQDTHLAKMIGVWRGRQVEEHKSREINKALVSRFKGMYDTDISKNPAASREYINLFDSKDPIHMDAIKLMPTYMRRALEAEFGKDTFMVRKEMVDSAIGYRTPSVGDAWTGVSGWSPESLELAKRVTMSVFGNKAYEYLVNAEQLLKNAIQDVKLIIVVKSVIVPVGNMLSNIIQLMSRGVPIKDIVRGVPKKVSELNFYTKQRLRKIELEVTLRTAEGNGDVVATRKAKNELETIEDSFRRLSIWPLINAGEFSAISDVGISRDDIVLSEGRVHAYMESLVDKLPDGVRTAAKYGLVAKDTALFQGLQKAVEYGDFLAKAIQYDYLTGSKKLSKEDSLARISEEFVNYDLLMGRFREYAENIGLLWFTAFKVRSTKIAASIIRNNPFHALMSALPYSFMPAGTGSPIIDNGVAKVMSGDIWHSIGLGPALRAPTLNPWVNLAH